MILPTSLRGRDVVAVNEYPATTGLHTGHVNLSFYRRGADEGTYGYNAQGRDVKGRVHPSGVGPGGMRGGVEHRAGREEKGGAPSSPPLRSGGGGAAQSAP